MPQWLSQFAPILVLLAVVAVVLMRLPRVEIDHSDAFRKRRFWNWFPLGMTYAFLYMGRYNLTVAKSAFAGMGLMTNADFGQIFAVGAVTYGVAFLINGPICDAKGGRFTLLLGACGSAIANIMMGLVVYTGFTDDAATLKTTYMLLYAANMYFQSFGAVSIVKVNAAWFHVRERGVLGGIFGILISLGVYFAFDWNAMILKAVHTPETPGVHWVFFAPAAILLTFFAIDFFLIRDDPKGAGFDNFDVGDASSGQSDAPESSIAVFKRLLSNPVIITIALIEFCSGFLRNAIMHWGKIFSKQTGMADQFVFQNWGLMLCCAGILAGMFAGVISDHVFNSRRGPVAGILYMGMVAGCVAMFFVLGSPLLGWTVVFMSLCIIGVHGMLSGTASADFGGKKNAGIAVGLIDGFVYLGTGLQSFVLGGLLPDGEAAKDPANWVSWPGVMLPLAIVGMLLALKIWNAKPKGSPRGSAVA